MAKLSKNSIISYLQQHKDEFATKYAISSIGLFGSFATQTQSEESDIDLVYNTHSKGLTFKELITLEEQLTTAFHKKIDLVNIDFMNPLIKRKAMQDIIYV